MDFYILLGIINKMYTRNTSAAPDKIVHNGKINFGAFEGCPEKLDIRGVRGPFTGTPLPTVLTNLRIQSSLMFLFNIGPYIGTVDFFDHKIFGFADVTFWNKENGRKYAYRSFMGPRRRFIPHNMKNGFCASFNRHRYIRISWDHKHDRISMIFNLKGDSSRPSANAAFIAHYSNPNINEIYSVVPFPSKRRCMAAYLSTPVIHGALTLEKTGSSESATMEDTEGSALFCVNRAYYNFHTNSEVAAAAGESDGKKFSFQIFTSQENAIDSENLNGNVLCVNGECTLLPPVKITHPFGLNKKWIIQDFENMVDLTFTPNSSVYRDISFLILRTQLNTIYGTFEGVIKTKNDEKIVLHNFEGIAKKQILRM